MNYLIHILIFLQIYIILAFSLNIKTGYGGMFSLCQAVFYGTGAYVTAILLLNGFNFIFALVIAILINVLFNGIVVFYLAKRLRELYFTLATLAFQIIFYGIIYNWIKLTNGPYGITGIPKPIICNIEFSSPISFLLISTFFVLLTIIFFYFFHKTYLSKMIEATRDDEIWVNSLGKNPNRYKFVSIALSVIFATISGALYASYISYIDPSSFTINESILILTMVLIGGSGNIYGPITGAAIYILLPEFLRFLNFPDHLAANFQMILYALILLLIIRFKPSGLFGKFEFKS